MSNARTAEPLMVPGYGAQPTKYVAANDNDPDHNGPHLPAREETTPTAGNVTERDDWASHDYGQYVTEDDLVTTTFAPLESVILSSRPSSSDTGRTTGRGPIGSGKPYLYSAQDLVEKDIREKQLHSLDDIAKLRGFVYLGSPYSKYARGFDEAARVVAASAAALMRDGFRVYSPIAHGHAVAAHGLPLTWDFWKDQCQPMIDAASSLIVLEMHGWWDSVGLQYEFDCFLKAGKPVVYVEPSELGVREVV